MAYQDPTALAVQCTRDTGIAALARRSLPTAQEKEVDCWGTTAPALLSRPRTWRNDKRGVASLCIGGGEATALAIEV